MPHQIQFTHRFDQYDPEIAVVTGYIILEWTLIAGSMERLLNTFLMHDPTPPDRVSWSFERQGEMLTDYVRSLYANSPDEFGEYQRVFGEVMTIKRKRDSVAHGIPSICIYRGKTFPALWVANWTVAKRRKPLPATIHDLKMLAERASRLKQEWCWAAKAVENVFLRPIMDRYTHPSMRGKPGLPEIESLLNNPLRNPKPTKSPQPPASPLRWPNDTAGWQTTLPYTPAKGSVIQVATAILLEDVVISAQPPTSQG